MNYLALGDSVSIDKYTGVPGAGAVGQFARLIGADALQDLTHDGYTTLSVIECLEISDVAQPDVVTLTVGGNDLLQRSVWNIDRSLVGTPDISFVLQNLDSIARYLAAFNCRVIVNTVYDPTDGDSTILGQLGFAPEFRAVYDEYNAGVRELAARYGFILSDLQRLFAGHGIATTDTWVTMEIEPNLAGATAIADHWYRISRQA